MTAVARESLEEKKDIDGSKIFDVLEYNKWQQKINLCLRDGGDMGSAHALTSSSTA